MTAILDPSTGSTAAEAGASAGAGSGSAVPVAAAVVARPGRRAPVGALGRVLLVIASALFSVVVVLLLWELFLVAFKVNPFIGRSPLDVGRHLFTSPSAGVNRGALVDASFTTLRDAAVGLVAGTVAALTAAILFNLRRGVEQTFMPVAMVLQSVPLVALTPLIALIFGRGLLATTIIAGIVTFFPTLVNVNLALRGVPRESIDLLYAYGATRLTTLRKVQFPCALPALFASLRIAAPLALIGALLAEWLATGQGLGYLMLKSQTTFKLDQLWSAVALVTLYSVILYGIIAGLEAAVLARFAPEQVQARKR
jgi:ABC-type nitrate/sulfonate/bicarbonate transport system permease component